MKKYLFVGEKRSETAKKMNVTWVDKRLCAGHLSKAVEAISIDWNECVFLNVFERELKKHQIEHEFIYHPATRGTVRIIENYKAHVKERIGHIV
jgi:hypothetical protein